MATPTPSTMASETSPSTSPMGTPLTISVFPHPRRTRPSNLQTSNLASGPHHTAVPASAISASSMSVASSLQGSPVFSLDVAPGLTQSSSIQASPEPLQGRDPEQYPLNFQLPEPVLPQSSLSRKTSMGSLSHPAINPGNASVPETNKGLFRRLSNKATNTFRSPRRQSSAHGSTRGASVGPGLARPRQRSNSDLTNPFTDSDDEPAFDLDDKISFLNISVDSSGREPSPTSAPVSVSMNNNTSGGPMSVVAGPTYPLELLQGTKVVKCSKKRGPATSRKLLMLVLDPESAKISWDKSRPSKSIFIDDIKDIRTAEDIRQYRLDFGIPESEEPLCFSIIYATREIKPKTKMMHLMAEDPLIVNVWVSTLHAISMHRQDMMSSLMAFNDKAIRTYWKNELHKQLKNTVQKGEEALDLPGVERVCQNLHIHVSSDTLRDIFIEALGASPATTETAVKSGRLNFGQFQEFVRLMKRRADIYPIFCERASDVTRGMTLVEFLAFLVEVQGENVEADRAHWEAIFARFAKRSKPKETESDDVPRIGEAGLVSFLTSTYNLPIASAPKHYTLDRPINEYYISSSHNTYLLGRQVMGLSSVEGYISALMRGCRSVEVDCWDGGDGWPLVSHGWTMTTNIAFREVMNVINKYAFVKSEFPLWISLEVHCCPDQQRKMVAIMKEIFGARLVTEPLEGVLGDKLPSPSQLKNRILIKAKKPGHEEPAPERTGRRRGNSLTSPYSRPVVLDNSSIPSQSLPHSPLLTPTHPQIRRMGGKSRVNTITEGRVHDSTSGSPSDCDSGSERDLQQPVSPGSRTSKIVKELGDLAVYCAGIKFSGFEHPDSKTVNHIFSFHEGTFQRHGRPGDAKRALYRHNMRYLMRVYPHRGRVYSSNFDPLLMWRRGVQMAALNWQTFDLGMQLNQAMYDGGMDQSGYVLKPKEFREIQHFPYLPEHMVGGKRPRKNVKFSIDVISAQQLMRPHNMRERQTLDPYIEVEAFLADDKRNTNKQYSDAGPSKMKYKTSVARDNGFNPIFDQTYHFDFNTKYPDLIFIRWTVRLSDGGSQSDRNTILGTFTAKLTSLKQGYRTLPLLDGNGDRYLFSTIFCRIKVDAPMDVYVDYQEESTDGVNKLRSLGRTVFNRSNNSPKTSIDSGSQ